MKILTSVIAAGLLVALSGCPKPPVELTSLSIAPESARLARGETVQFVATALYSSGEVRDVTEETLWSVDDAYVGAASGEVKGLIQGLGEGSTVVRARFGGKNLTRALTVVPATLREVQLFPPHPVVPVGLGVPMKVTALRSDGSKQDVTAQAIWTVSAPGLVQVTDALVRGLSPGTLTVTASVQGITATVPVDVTNAQVTGVDVQPASLVLPVGVEQRLGATALLSDGSSLDVTTQVAWASSAPAVAFVSELPGEQGLVAARAPGKARVTATVAGQTGACDVSVNPTQLVALELSPPATTLALGTAQQFTATGVFADGTTVDLTPQATWSSTQASVFTVQAGLVRSVAVGAALLSARFGALETSRELRVSGAALIAIQLEPSPAVVLAGLTLQLHAIGAFTDGSQQDLTDQVTWRSADAAVAQVSNAVGTEGRVFGSTRGSVELTATLAGVVGRTQLTVSAGALTMVQVTPTSPTLARGQVLPFTATGLFSDGTTQDLTSQVTWTSSDAAKLSISNQPSSHGLARALAQGQVEVRAALSGQVGVTAVTITGATLAALELEPQGLALPVGVAARLSAIGVYSDGSRANLTTQVAWSSSEPGLASVSNAPGTQGEVRGLAVGAVTVRAQLGALTGSAPLTVTAATLASLELDPPAATIAVGLTRDFKAIATYSDGTTRDVTAQASFSVQAPAIATVSSSPLQARVVGQSAGSTKLVARVSSLSAEAALTVTPAQLSSLSLTPTTLTLARGTHGQLAVEASWSDGSSADVTSQVSFSSTDLAVVTVSNAAGTEGQLTAVGMGTAQVRAQLGMVTASTTVTVTNAALVSLEVTPPSPAIPLGAAQRFVATGRYTDGSAQDLSAQATWTSSAPLVLALSNAAGQEGTATALAQGSARVTASVGGLSGSTQATVTAARLGRVDLTPATPRLAKDTRLALHATGVWTDGATQDLTAGCTWSSADASLATVSNAPGAQGRVFGVAPGQVLVSASCAGVTGSVTVEVTNAVLLAIELTPSSPSAAAGFTQQLTATGRFTDGTTQPFTDFVTWGTADASRATVSQLGLVSARAQGPVGITAQALGVTGAVTFQVTAAVLQGLSLAPSPAAVPKGLTQAFDAIGAFSDGTTATLTEGATWSSSQPSVASISNAAGSRGRATALAEGVTTISATLGGFSASATLTVTPAQLVSLSVTPANPTLARGLAQVFTATGTFSDGTTRDLSTAVTWSVGDGGVASISNADMSRGLVRALAVGTTAITATLGPVSGSSTLTVSAAALVSLGLTPATPTVARGSTLPLVATGVYTDGSTQDLTAQGTWSVANGAIASVSNAPGSQGRLSGLTVGSTTVDVTFGAVSASAPVTVTPAALQSIALTPPAPSVAAGLSLNLTATGVFTDATTQDVTALASWSSSDASIARVSAGGVVTAVRVGTVTLSATTSGVTGTVSFTVSAALLTQVQVTPSNVSRPKGLPQQFTATGVFTDQSTADLTASATWASSDGTKLSISNAAGSQGLGATLGVGSVTVSATWNGVTGSTPFSVTAAALTGLTVAPGGSSVSLGSVRQYVATGRFTDGSTQNLTSAVTWASSNPSVASVSNAPGSRGLATTLATGSTAITASLGGFSGASNLVVIQNALARLDLTPAAGATALGYSRQFIAIGTYTDGTTQVLTSQVTWATDDAAVAIVSNADGSRGLLSTVGLGNVQVSATLGGITGSTAHAVTPAVLLFLEVTPGAVTVGLGGTAPLVATGTFSDGSQQDLTAAVTWTALDPSVAQVSNAAGSEGLVTGIVPGSTTVTAAQGGVSAGVPVTVQ